MGISLNPMNDPSRESSAKHIASLLTLFCGVSLIILSLIWPSVSTGRSQWSYEQAREYQSVSGELHGLSHQAAHQEEVRSDVDALADKVKAAQSEFQRLHEELETARQSPLRVATALRFLGVVLVVLGAIIYYHQWSQIHT
jgi:predicted PurR-regulated permease PerM